MSQVGVINCVSGGEETSPFQEVFLQIIGPLIKILTDVGCRSNLK